MAKFVRVLFDWEAERDSDLSIHTGDIIKIDFTKDRWAVGTLNGRQGQFPLNYTEILDSSAGISTPPLSHRLDKAKSVPTGHNSILNSSSRPSFTPPMLPVKESSVPPPLPEPRLENKSVPPVPPPLPEYVEKVLDERDVTGEKKDNHEDVAYESNPYNLSNSSLPPAPAPPGSPHHRLVNKNNFIRSASHTSLPFPPPAPPPGVPPPKPSRLSDVAPPPPEMPQTSDNYKEELPRANVEPEQKNEDLISPVSFKPPSPPNPMGPQPPHALSSPSVETSYGKVPQSRLPPTLPPRKVPKQGRKPRLDVEEKRDSLNDGIHHRKDRTTVSSPLTIDQKVQDRPDISFLSPRVGRGRQDIPTPDANVQSTMREDSHLFKLLWKYAVEMRMTIHTKDRRSGLKVYKQCFLGSEAVDWLVKYRRARNRAEATIMGNRIMDHGMITHAAGADCFKDSSKSCYVFLDSPLYGRMQLPGDEGERLNAIATGGLIYSSTVLKLGGAFKNKLQQRYMEFSRCDDYYVLKYFNNIRKDPKGVVYLTGDCKVEAEKKGLSFSIFGLDKKYHFQCLMEEHFKIWMNVLQNCINLRLKRWKEEKIAQLPKDQTLRDKASKFIDTIELGEHKHKKSGTHLFRSFRGKEAVETIVRAGLAETAHNGIVFGNLLIEHRIIKSYSNEHPFENKKHLYLLFFEETSSEEETRLMNDKTKKRKKSFILPVDFATTRVTMNSKKVISSQEIEARVKQIDSVDSPSIEEEGPKTFREGLPHCIESIIEQTRKGLLSSAKVASYCSQMAKNDLRACEQQLKIAKSNKHEPYEDCVPGLYKILTVVESCTEVYWERHQARANAALKKVIRPWKETLNGLQEELKAVEKRYRKAKTERDDLVRKLESTFKRCNKLIHKMKKRMAAKEFEGGELSSKKSPRVWANMFRGERTSEEDILGKLKILSQDYNDQLMVVNDHLDKFEADCENMAHQLQTLSETHLSSTKMSLLEYSGMTIKETKQTLTGFQAVCDTTKRYSADNDIQCYIVRTIRKQGKQPKPERFHYDLPFTLQDIKNGDLQGSNSIFDATLDQVMKIQREANNKDVAMLPVPAIVLVLISAIQRSGGYVSEGIFRVSAAKKDIDRLKAQIDIGNYQVEEKSPHIPACLLKQWIRRLPEPIIPSTLYHEAINLARKPEISKVDVEGFVVSIPHLNRAVIEYIANMAQEIEKFENMNRMNIKNIAIVFAPGLLQFPGEDPQAMLANSKFEIKFTVALFQHFPIGLGGEGD